MKTTIETLLEPISDENPCGEDIGYDPQFLELETMLAGKEETQFAASEEPDWKAVVERCLELFKRSKDLRVALRLTLGLLQTEGLPGFRDGLRLLTGMIGTYWEPIYPRLDPDDNNDPLERVNVLASLATPAGTFGDPMQFLKRIRLAPLAESSQMGKIAMIDIDRVIAGTSAPDGTSITNAQIAAAFRGTPPEKSKRIFDAITESSALVVELDTTLTKAVGARNSVTFEPLAKALKELLKAVSPYAPASGKTDGAAPSISQVEGSEPSRHPGGFATTGTLNSRADVIRLLDQICDFYKLTEPSSPVPLILRRARRLVDMDFLQLLTELTPEALTQLKVITGIRDAEVETSAE